jgi:predicted membrane protein
MKMNKCNDNSFTHIKRAKITMGILVVIFGTLLLLKNTSILPAEIGEYVISWQSLLIFLGLFSIIKHKGQSFFGVALFCVGSYFIIDSLYVIPFETLHIVGPILIVFLGLTIIFKRIKKPCIPEIKLDNNDPDAFEDVRIFGGGKIIIDSQNFKGGKSLTVFGGNEINLSMAKLRDGVNVIEIFAVFGGSEIIVPSNWNVKVEVAGILGGFNDERIIHPNIKYDNDKILIIKGFAIFGGGEVKSI